MKTQLNFCILLLSIFFFCSSKTSTVSAQYSGIDESKNKIIATPQNPDDTTTYAFSIGSKFTLKLNQIDAKHFKYTVIDYKEIKYSIDYSKTDSIFNKTVIPGTIECFFAKGTDQKGPFKSVLILRNNTKKIIEYEALISYIGYEGFSKTSTTPLFPGVRGIELWNNNLSAIVIRNLKVQE